MPARVGCRCHMLRLRRERALDDLRTSLLSTIQGRGEFRALSARGRGIRYVDVARTESRDRCLRTSRRRRGTAAVRAAVLEGGRLIIAQTANILLFLGERHGLRRRQPRVDCGRINCSSRSPISSRSSRRPSSDCARCITKTRSARRSGAPQSDRRALAEVSRLFRGGSSAIAQTRMPGGRAAHYADLSAFQLVAGLAYAYRRHVAARKKAPCLMQLHADVRARPALRPTSPRSGEFRSTRRASSGTIRNWTPDKRFASALARAPTWPVRVTDAPCDSRLDVAVIGAGAAHDVAPRRTARPARRADRALRHAGEKIRISGGGRSIHQVHADRRNSSQFDFCRRVARSRRAISSSGRAHDRLSRKTGPTLGWRVGADIRMLEPNVVVAASNRMPCVVLRDARAGPCRGNMQAPCGDVTGDRHRRLTCPNPATPFDTGSRAVSG